MAKSGPKPRNEAPPLWKQPRPMAAVGGGLVGLLALILGVQQYFSSGNPDTSPQRMEQWVDEYLQREAKESAAERHADADKKVRTLVEVMSAPGFNKLPQDKKDAIRNRHRELRDYEEYAQALAKVPDPQKARTEAELKSIRETLQQVRVPPEYFAEWSGTPARTLHNEWLADCEALEKAVRNLIREYQTLAQNGRHVLKNSAAANLPSRAKEVLDRARELPGPQSATPLDGSRRLTVAAAFAFTDVADAVAEWQGVRKKLEGVAGLRKP